MIVSFDSIKDTVIKIKMTLSKFGREDLLKVPLPEKEDKWRKNKPTGQAKNMFNGAVPFNLRKNKAKFRSKRKRR